jgi:glycosyltransferase involved in cell wall biosynthesis
MVAFKMVHLSSESLDNRRTQYDDLAFPILVKVWAGTQSYDFRYIQRSLPSLLQSDLPDCAHVIIVNDCSPDPRLHGFLKECAAHFARVTLWMNPYRMGPNNGHAYNVPKVVELFPQAPFYVFCDDDVLYHPGWLTRLIQTYHEARQEGIEGIFTALNVPARPTSSTRLLPTSEVMLKRRQFALNWLVPAEIYHKVGPFRTADIAFDTDYCQRLNAQGFWIVCLKPSYVQNIGLRGFYHSDNTHDIFYAQDYVGRVGLGVRLEQWQGNFRRWLDRIPPGFVRHILKSTFSPLRKP